MIARSLLVGVVCLGVGCHSRARRVDEAVVNMQASVFDDEFDFQCSPKKEVGCSGLFEVRARPASRAAVLHSGEEAFGMRIASLEAAKKSIRIQALIFRADEAGLFIAETLKRKVKEGVRVQVIVDAPSNLGWKTQWMYFDMKLAGIEVEGYEALYLQWWTAEKMMQPWRANKRFHDKMWVVDAEDPEAKLAIVGGLNIANEYFRVAADPENRWRDQDVVLRGAVVDDVAAAFDRNYVFFKGIKNNRPGIFNPDNYWKLTRKILEKIRKTKLPKWLNHELQQMVIAFAAKKPRLEFKPVEARFLQSRPRLKESYIRQGYLSLFETAEESIYVANAYFIPSRRMIESLQRAARRGVRVVVVTNSPESNDVASVAAVSRFIYQDILAVNQEPDLKGSIEVWEWKGREAGEGTLHAKYAVIDSKVAIIGSYNLDPRSAHLNSETAVVLRDKAIGTSLAARFTGEVLQKSRRVAWEDVRGFRRPDALKDKFELVFSLAMKDWL